MVTAKNKKWREKKLYVNVDCIRCFSVWWTTNTLTLNTGIHSHLSFNLIDVQYVTHAHHWRVHRDRNVYIAWENPFGIHLTDDCNENANGKYFLRKIGHAENSFSSPRLPKFNTRIKFHSPVKKQVRCKLESVCSARVLFAITLTECIQCKIWHDWGDHFQWHSRFRRKRSRLADVRFHQLWNINKNNNWIEHFYEKDNQILVSFAIYKASVGLGKCLVLTETTAVPNIFLCARYCLKAIR